MTNRDMTLALLAFAGVRLGRSLSQPSAGIGRQQHAPTRPMAAAFEMTMRLVWTSAYRFWRLAIFGAAPRRAR